MADGGDYGAGGVAAFVPGPVSGTAVLTDLTRWTNPDTDGRAGHALAAGGDLTGDGLPDVVVGA